jgi:hypothetical protein
MFLGSQTEEVFVGDTSNLDVRRDNIGFRLVRVPAAQVLADGGAAEPVGMPKLPGNSAPARGDGIEVAITRVAPWEGFDPYRQLVGGPGLAGARGIRTVVTEGRDAAGHPLRRGGIPPK